MILINRKPLFVLIFILLFISCSGSTIEGAYVADFTSYKDPTVKRTGQLFKDYQMSVVLTIYKKKAKIDIKGMGINKHEQLNIQHFGNRIKIVFPQSGKKSGSNKVAEFTYKDANTIVCFRCPEKMPIIWRKRTSL